MIGSKAYLIDQIKGGLKPLILEHADLSRADLRDADLRDANLSGADLFGANLSDAILNDAILSRAILSRADLRDANLRGANLFDANLIRANLSRANLGRANLGRADLSGANLSGANLSCADLSGQNLSGASLSGANLIEANLSRTDLSGQNLSGASLSGANLRDANLRDANLRDANLRDANLRDTNLSRANLIGVNLSGAVLSGAVLSGANLSRADLSDANLSGADLSDANLSGANLSGADLSGADLSDANLTLARLLLSDLSNAVLTGANLWETQRSGWIIKNVECESIDWNSEVVTYKAGEFERLFSDLPRIRIQYEDGMDPLEFMSLHALIQYLQNSSQDISFAFKSIEESAGGMAVNVTLTPRAGLSPEEIEQRIAEIQKVAEEKAKLIRKAVCEENLKLKGRMRSYEGEIRAYRRIVDRIGLPTSVTVAKGEFKMGDNYEIKDVSGQSIVIGSKSHVHDQTFNQVSNSLSNTIDLTALASELSHLRVELQRHASEKEDYLRLAEIATAIEASEKGDATTVTKSLKAAGKWALDAATKIGTTIAADAIKKSMEL